MSQPDILDSEIRAMQQWLREAWQQLAEANINVGPLRGGMVLNSGLGAATTEVVFNEVDVH